MSHRTELIGIVVIVALAVIAIGGEILARLMRRDDRHRFGG